ncbi:lipopolysaccharide biosynthesis protein [Cellulosimicrobium sp. Marseille-Q8652]
MTHAQVAVRGATATFVGQGLRFGIQVASVVLLSRMLDPADVGSFAMVVALVGLALLVGDSGLSTASIQAEDVTADERTNLFWLNLALGTTCGAAVLLASWPIAAFYGIPALVPVVQAMSVLFVVQAARAQFSANAAREFAFGRLAVVDVAAQAAGLAAAVAVALGGGGIWALVVQQLGAAVCALVVIVAMSSWRPGLPRKGVSVRRFLRLGGNTLALQALNYATANVDSVLLGRFQGAAVVGVYDRAYQFFRMPLQQVAAPLTRVALPVLSRIHDDAVYGRYVVRAQLILVYGLGGAFAVAVAVADPLFAVLLGPGWSATPSLFTILAVGGLFQVLGYVYYWIFVSRDKTGVQLRVSVVSRVAMIGLMCAGVPWGATGVAVGVSAGLALNWVALTVVALPRTGIAVRDLLVVAVRPVVVLVTTVLVVRAVAAVLSIGAPVVELGALLVACAVVLGASLLVPGVRRDVRALRSTLDHWRKRA